ncbi:MAG TPA: PilN domain-containing protein [Candidatus Acidoferrum sp.]|nr:PilN domain-containing protein [Candidatus Acidoferrum sp.]
MRVHLNLATKPMETHRRFLVGSGLVAVVAGVALVWLGWHVYTVREANAELRARFEETRRKTENLDAQRAELERFFQQKKNKELNDRAVFLNSIIDARSFNWTQMFMDLERILPGGVRVISIEPKQVEGHVEVTLSVVANSEEAELKFLRALEESKVFTGVQVQHIGVPNLGTNQSSDQKLVLLSTIYSRS